MSNNICKYYNRRRQLIIYQQALTRFKIGSLFRVINMRTKSARTFSTFFWKKHFNFTFFRIFAIFDHRLINWLKMERKSIKKCK